MTYVEEHKNKELKKYFKIFSLEYPTFIDKYINTKEMQRLHKIGQFCGCDYTKLHSCKYWYSRLDHSVSCALMAWHFTKDMKQTLGALFHDLGTPSFSHCIDFLLNDTMNQESSEKNVKDILLNSKEIVSFLKEDNIQIEDVTNIEKYTILENKKPKICIDRLEGVLHTGLVWCHFWSIEDIKEIYENITILTNEDNEQEIGFKDIRVANKFFEGVFKYSIVLQQNEDKFTMAFISCCLKDLLDNNKINMEDLYILSEEEIINIFKDFDLTKKKWSMFENTTTLYRTDEIIKDKYCISIDCKKRYVIPLISHKGKVCRLNKASKKCERLLQDYLNYSDSKYSYIKLE